MSVIKDERVYKRSMVAVERSDDLEDDSWGPDSWCNPRKQEKDLKCTRQCKLLIVCIFMVQMSLKFSLFQTFINK